MTNLSYSVKQDRENLLDLRPADVIARLRAFAAEHDVAEYRGNQAARRLWTTPVQSFAEIAELPVAFREQLDAAFALPRLELVTRQQSADGTQKFLFRLPDGESVETVTIPDGNRLTACISSQAGCALQCAFCATGAMGFARNLGPWEIAGQVRELMLLDPPLRPTNVVFMGMGEPMMNWRNVDVALTLLNDPAAIGIGARHITVSTVGVLPGIEALAARPEQFRLAISVHAPLDELRQKLMPINTKYPLAGVIAAARGFVRRVTFEYVLLGGVNDTPGSCGAARGARRRVRRVRQPHSPAPGREPRVQPKLASRDRGLRTHTARARRRSRGPQEPRSRHQRGVRTATGRTAGAAAANPRPRGR